MCVHSGPNTTRLHNIIYIVAACESEVLSCCSSAVPNIECNVHIDLFWMIGLYINDIVNMCLYYTFMPLSLQLELALLAMYIMACMKYVRGIARGLT